MYFCISLVCCVFSMYSVPSFCICFVHLFLCMYVCMYLCRSCFLYLVICGVRLSFNISFLRYLVFIYLLHYLFMHWLFRDVFNSFVRFYIVCYISLSLAILMSLYLCMCSFVRYLFSDVFLACRPFFSYFVIYLLIYVFSLVSILFIRSLII